MPSSASDSAATDPFDLQRFVIAQQGVYERALAEVRSGEKRSHWMWFIFPQYAGLGHSAMAQRYAIQSATESRDYLKHPVLGPRLYECFAALLAVEGRTAHEIFGAVDAMKLRSCATLFAAVTAENSAFERVLDQYFDGQPDVKTQQLIH